MTLASSVETLFAGPSAGLLTAILVLAAGAAAAVLWTLIRLVVDPRACHTDDGSDARRLEWDEVADPAYGDGYAVQRGDGTG